MKSTIAKLLVLALAVTVLLTGCNLVVVDPVMQAQEDMKALNKRYEVPVATYDGGVVTVGETMADFYNTYTMWYSYLGNYMTEDYVSYIAEDVISIRVQNEVLAAKFDAAGYELTEEEMATATEAAQTNYASAFDSLKTSATGKTDEAKAAQTELAVRELGMDYETLLANAVIDTKASKMEETIRGEVTEVTEEQLQAAYDEKVASDEEQYADNANSFVTAMSSDTTTVYWMPEGYRMVKHILVKPADEVLAAYTDAESALTGKQSELSGYQDEMDALTDDDHTEEELAAMRNAEEIQADIDAAEAAIPSLEEAVATAKQACLDDVNVKTTEIYAKLAEGADFEALIQEYGEDPGMANEPTATRGYCVNATTTRWQTSFRDASMALANVGDYTAEPVVSGSGVHIIQYVSDVTPGAVALEDVREALTESTLEDLKDNHFSTVCNEWMGDYTKDVDAFTAALNASED